MAKVHGAVVIDIQKCKGCRVCVVACPNKVLELAKEVNGKGYNYSEMKNTDCTGCTNCAVVCPEGIITVYREKMAKKE